MKADTFTIPTTVAVVIIGVYFGAIAILDNLRRAYLAPTVGQPPTAPIAWLSTQISVSVALAVFACVLIVGFAAGRLMFGPTDISTKSTGV